METDRSPFIVRDIACPSCGQSSRQRSFRTRMFIPEEKESDQHVIRYKWLVDNVSQVHPPYYFLFFCPHCHFCDLTDEFEDPRATPYAQRVAKTYQNAEQRARLIAVLLAKHINYDDIDHCSALNLHYLALFQQMLVPEDLTDNYKVARLLLRIAWLHREANPETGTGVKIPGVEDALEEFDRFDDLLNETRNLWKRIVSALKSRIDDLDAAGPPDSNPYRERLSAVNRHMDGLSRETYGLKNTCRKDRQGALLSPEGKETATGFFGYASYDAFFEQLKGVWPFAPADEHEAMRLAIQYFEKALSTDARLDDANTRHNVMALVIDLFVRCDDIRGALNIIRGAHKAAFDARARCQQEMRDKDKDELEKRRIKARMERIGAALEQVSALRRTLLNEMYARDKERIEKIVTAYEGHPLETIEEALTAAGIEPEQIAALREPGGALEGLAAAKKKKLGLF